MEELLQLADLQRVGAGLGQEPVVLERGERRGDGLQPRTQVALAVLPPRPRGHAHPRRAAHAARAAAAAGGGEVGWLGVVQRLEEDGRGDVLRVVLGPAGDLGQQPGHALQRQQPRGGAQHGGGREEVCGRVGVVRAVARSCPQGDELDPRQHAAQHGHAATQHGLTHHLI